MAAGDLIADADGNEISDANGDVVGQSDDCCYRKLVKCSDNSVSAFTIRKSDIPGSAPNSVIKRAADSVCYYPGDATPCAGTDAGSGTWYADCSTCLECYNHPILLTSDQNGAGCVVDGTPDFNIGFLAPTYFCRGPWNELYATANFTLSVGASSQFGVCTLTEVRIFVNGVDATGNIAGNTPPTLVNLLTEDRVQVYVNTSCGDYFHDKAPNWSFLSRDCPIPLCGRDKCCPPDHLEGRPTTIMFDGEVLTLHEPGDPDLPNASPGPDLGDSPQDYYFVGTTTKWIYIHPEVCACQWTAWVKTFDPNTNSFFVIYECDPEGTPIPT